MIDKLEIKEEEDKKADRVYEVGFLIVPSITAEKVASEFASIKSSIEKYGGRFISEEPPYLRPLAYTIVKLVEAKNQKFDNAYFGWIKFEIDPANLADVNTSLKSNENILRFINIKTVKESTYSPSKQISQADSLEEGIDSLDSEVSLEEIDRSIDEALVE